MPSMPRTPLTAQTRTALPAPGTRLGERLRQLRVAAGLTQTDLAALNRPLGKLEQHLGQILPGRFARTRSV